MSNTFTIKWHSSVMVSWQVRRASTLCINLRQINFTWSSILYRFIDIKSFREPYSHIIFNRSSQLKHILLILLSNDKSLSVAWHYRPKVFLNFIIFCSYRLNVIKMLRQVLVKLLTHQNGRFSHAGLRCNTTIFLRRQLLLLNKVY